MLCERFHKRLKHDILEGKANVRIDSLINILISLVTEMEEDREIMAINKAYRFGRWIQLSVGDTGFRPYER
ncbi:hypothetical protein OESDEN_12125 [Oesophagostomum dentatum]|uniref:Uncharacterized protein n=1 Tax=Oesophagostomum dentatum TaxID=61180 RepID=A0A0B1SY36_OESDE|nr:hypothetical protein OESDEN_12125 [Oesophagostomum dentatum]